MYQLNRHAEAGEDQPSLSHTSAKPFATTSPHVLSLPSSTASSFAVESYADPHPTPSRTSHSGVICLTLTAAVLALLFFLLAALAPVRLVHVVSYLVASQLLLSSPSSPSFASFLSNADNPLLLSVYVYNVTNAADMFNHSAPAVLDEIGPFVFADTRRKLDPTFTSASTNSSASLSYIDWQTLTFLPQQSCARCVLDANLTTANLVTQAAYHGALTQQRMSNGTSELLLDLFNLDCIGYNDTGLLPLLFTTRPVRDVLFGYADSVTGVSFPGYFVNLTQADTLAAELTSTISTGVDDLPAAHQYVSWQNQSVLYTCAPTSNPAQCAWNSTVWTTEAASTVRGGDGILFTDEGGITAASSPLLFFYPFRRTIALEYAGTSSHAGLSTLDYSFPSSFFRSSSVYAGNGQFYQYLDGAVNLTSTASFTPLFATLPHLANVDTSSPLYPQNLTVLHGQPAPPTNNVFSIHPTSGVLAHLSTSFQLNVLLQPIKYTLPQDGQPVTEVWGAELTPGLLPLFYATEQGGLSAQQAAELLQVDEVDEVLQWSPHALWPAGAVCAAAALYGAFWLWRTRRAEVSELTGAKGAEEGAEAGVRFGEKSRLRAAAGGYGWYGQAQTEPDEEEDGV